MPEQLLTRKRMTSRAEHFVDRSKPIFEWKVLKSQLWKKAQLEES